MCKDEKQQLDLLARFQARGWSASVSCVGDHVRARERKRDPGEVIPPARKTRHKPQRQQEDTARGASRGAPARED